MCWYIGVVEGCRGPLRREERRQDPAPLSLEVRGAAGTRGEVLGRAEPGSSQC